MRSRNELAVLDRAQEIDLHFSGRYRTPAVKVIGQSNSHGNISKGSHHAAVHHSSAIAKPLAHGACDGHPVGMLADDADADQLVERHAFRKLTKFSQGQGKLIVASSISSGHKLDEPAR